MNRKILAAVAAALLLGASVRAEEAKAVEKALDALNKAFEKGDAKAAKGRMTGDHVAVTPYYGGPQARDEQLKSLPDFKLEEYRPEKMKVRMLGKDAALVTYALAMKGTYKGKPVPRKNYASAVWVRRDGKWLEAFYQETALGGK